MKGPGLPRPAARPCAVLARWRRPPGDFVLAGALLNLGYAAVLIMALGAPASRAGAAVGAWVVACRKAFDLPYALAGASLCGGTQLSSATVRAWVFDVHLIVVNLAIVALLLAASRPSWPDWTEQAPRTVADVSGAADECEGYGTVLWGALAVLWWILLENALFDTRAHCDAFRPWMLLREPLLATAGHGFASFAVAFHPRIRP